MKSWKNIHRVKGINHHNPTLNYYNLHQLLLPPPAPLILIEREREREREYFLRKLIAEEVYSSHTAKLNHDSNIKFPSVLLHIFFLNVSLILLQVTTTATMHTTQLGLSKYKKV